MSFRLKLSSRLQTLAELRDRTGRSVSNLLGEIFVSQWSGFAPWEYLCFKLYEAENFRNRHTFASERRCSALIKALNKKSSWVLQDDKLICQSILEQAGIPVPRIQAVFTPKPRACALARVYHKFEQLPSILERLEYPLFVKPIGGSRGIGCFRADSWNGRFLKTSLGALSVPEFVEHIRAEAVFGDPGVLLAEVIAPHQKLRALHSATSTVRLGVLVTPSGPVAVRAALRIPSGDEVVDNIDLEKGRNMFAQVDTETGLVSRAVSGFGLNEKVFEYHPESAARIAGLRLPHWEQSKEVALKGSLLFPGLKFQHWDIALAETGPVVLEVNVRGGLKLYQLPMMQPLLDESTRKILREASD